MSARIILITGGNGGLGQAIARAFLNESPQAHVFLGVRSRRDKAESLAREFRERCECLELEVTDADSWRNAVRTILTSHKGADVLVNNAGLHADGLLATMPADDWRRVIDANLNAAF